VNIEIDKIATEIADQIRKSGMLSSGTAGSAAVNQSGGNGLAGMFEHSMLHKGVTQDEIAKACEQSKKFGIAGLVVPIWHAKFTAGCLAGSGVGVITAISFPNGGQSLACKTDEVKQAIAAKVSEIDIEPNFERLAKGRIEEEKAELQELFKLAKSNGLRTKLVIEWGYFSDEMKTDILKMAVGLGADFVKIQHFLKGGKALPEEVKFIREKVGNSIGIKIDGGIKTAEFCNELIAAGANRMGLTATFAILSK
jgi:deoxyribose-phosphate aldolase